MKFILGLLKMVAVSSAQAELKPNGTILPTACAKSVRSSARVGKVCFAPIVGIRDGFLTVGDDVWSTQKGSVNTDSLNHVGTNENGRLVYRLTTDMRVGTLERGTGDMVNLKIPNKVIQASDFETQFHTLN